MLINVVTAPAASVHLLDSGTDSSTSAPSAAQPNSIASESASELHAAMTLPNRWAFLAQSAPPARKKEPYLATHESVG